MKYCFPYNQKTEHAKYINEVDEWTIKYNNKDTTLLEFLELHKDKRINLYFTEKVDLDFLNDLAKKFPNLYFKLTLEYLSEILENFITFLMF